MGWEDREYYRDDQQMRKVNLPKPTSMATVLIAVCVVIYMLQRVAPFGESLTLYGRFTYQDGLWLSQPWRWITYQYLHGSFGHLIWNMISIYFMVPILERYWGWKRTFALYTCAGIASCVTLKLLSPWIGDGGGLVGASGSILGVLGAIAYLAPQMNVMFMMIAPMSMRAVASLYAIVYSLTILTDRDHSDAAHLGGLVFGVITPWILKGTNFRRNFDQISKWQEERQQQSELAEQREVDRILEKVAEQGMHSLTGAEKKALARATANQNARDSKRSRSR